MRRQRLVLASASISFALVFSGCGATKDVGGEPDLIGDGGSSFDIGGEGGDLESGIAFQDIELTPGNATIYIDTATTPATPATVSYKALLHNADGTTKDVTSSVVLQLDDSTLGTFAGAKFTSVSKLPGATLGVTTVVHGTAEGKTGAANLTLVQLRKSGDHRDFFFVVPYLGAPSPDRDVLVFGTNIKQVDVAFSVDTTGSMGSSIDTLKDALSSTLMPALVKAIPSVGLAVVDHKDSQDGDPWTAKVLQTITTDVTLAKAAVSTMTADGGGDEPEAQEQSMLHILTGEEIPSSPVISRHVPAPGTFGGVDFRPGSLPVVVEITDAHWHDATTLPPAETTMVALEAAFKRQNARFVGVTDMHYASSEIDPFPLLTQPQQLCDATGSQVPVAAFSGACGAGQCCTGLSGAGQAPDGPGGTCRLSFQIQDGAGLGDSVVKAIQAISVGSQFDVTAQPSNDPSNADGVDATKFVKALRAMDEGSGKECPPHAAKDTNGDGIKDTFIAVVVGTPVCFEVLPQENTTVHPKPVAQFFNAFIDVLGMPGAVKLDRRNVLFLVPPKEIGAK